MGKRVFVEELEIGDKVYVDGYKSEATFQGFVLKDGKPRATFTEFDRNGNQFEWEAYLFWGKFCHGSSADPLKMFRV